MNDTPHPESGPDAVDRPQHGLETRILRGAAWTALGFGSRQIVTWLSMLVLVRLLEPEAFGVMALALTIVTALQLLRGSGLSAALVFRRTGIEEAAASALVYLTLSGIVVYGVCFATAPFFASWFGTSGLTDVIRVLAVVVFVGGLGIVPGAILERELMYAAAARVDLGAAAVQFGAAVGLAAAGAGVWSLVAGQLGAAVFEVAMLWYLVPWRPSPRRANRAALRELFRYGRFAGGANIATFVSGTVDTVVIGRILGATAVGFYTVALRLATTPESVFGYLIVKAMFPAFSLVQADPVVFRRIFVQHAQRMALLVLPVTVFLALAAEPIVLTLLGDEWSSVVTVVRILAVFGFVRALSATTGAVFRGAGRPELAMWFAVANVVLLVPALILLTRWLELEGAAIAVLVCLSATTLPASARMLKLVGLSARELVHTLLPSLACSGVLALVLAVLVPSTSGVRPAVSLIVLLAAGAVAYLAGAVLFARSVVVPMWLDLRGTRS
jgi:PST family polysaccharide transporter